MPSLPARLLFILALALGAGTTAAQSPEDAEYAPRSGDSWIDRQLADINAYAARYPHSYADEMARYYSVPRDYVEALLQQQRWPPGDIFMACALAQAVAQPCRAVVREWSHGHADGWAGVARRLQAKPGSAPYRKLRQEISQSYARWARPIAE